MGSCGSAFEGGGGSSAVIGGGSGGGSGGGRSPRDVAAGAAGEVTEGEGWGEVGTGGEAGVGPAIGVEVAAGAV